MKVIGVNFFLNHSVYTLWSQSNHAVQHVVDYGDVGLFYNV